MEPTTTTTPSNGQPSTTRPDGAAEALVAEDLIEEVSIDGMCGVY